jgi:hypothetical protein
MTDSRDQHEQEVATQAEIAANVATAPVEAPLVEDDGLGAKVELKSALSDKGAANVAVAGVSTTVPAKGTVTVTERDARLLEQSPAVVRA